MIAGIIILAIIALVILLTGSIFASKGLNVQHIKKIYLYLVSVIALVIMVIGGIILLNMALKTWVFTKADNNFYLDTYRCSTVTPTTEPTTEKPVTPTCTAEQEEKQRKEHEEQRTANKQNDAAQAVAMILVASPVWYFHWRLARKEV
jgi:hypothetical protein